MVRAAADVKPAITGIEMKSITKPGGGSKCMIINVFLFYISATGCANTKCNFGPIVNRPIRNMTKHSMAYKVKFDQNS